MAKRAQTRPTPPDPTSQMICAPAHTSLPWLVPDVPDAQGGLIGAGPISFDQIPEQVSNTDLSPDLQDADLARETLRAVCRDPAAPAAARAQAARTLAEMAQALGRHAAPVVDPGKPVGELSRADLEAELAALSGVPAPLSGG